MVPEKLNDIMVYPVSLSPTQELEVLEPQSEIELSLGQNFEKGMINRNNVTRNEHKTIKSLKTDQT